MLVYFSCIYAGGVFGLWIIYLVDAIGSLSHIIPTISVTDVHGKKPHRNDSKKARFYVTIDQNSLSKVYQWVQASWVEVKGKSQDRIYAYSVPFRLRKNIRIVFQARLVKE